MLSVALLILVFDKGPVLYAHERIGTGGKKFKCLKFRTMLPDSDARLEEILATNPAARAEWLATRKLSNDPRISWIGNFLRKTSLDELPQFWNVLKGEMSMVGPRPIVEAERSFYGEYYADYISVRPGLTGAWQVGGRSNTTYDQRVAMDVHYVRNRSLREDLRIVGRTVFVILARDGAR